MQFLLQKTGLAILVLSLSGMVNAAPAIAGVTDSYDEVNPELSSEEVDEVTDTINSDVVPDTLSEEVDSDVEVMSDDMSETFEGEETVAEDSDTIVDVATSSETFTTLVSALSETELVEVLQGDGPFTVFAPTDEAFEALPEGTLDALMAPENRDVLVSLLSYHVVPEALPSEQLETGFVDSVQGTPLQVEVGEEVTVNGITIVDEEIPASNGVIHTIDQVILPPQ